MNPRISFLFLLVLFSSGAGAEPPKHVVGTTSAKGDPNAIFDRYFEDSSSCLEKMRDAKTGFLSDKVLIQRRSDGFDVKPLLAAGQETHNADTSPTNIGLDLLLQLERGSRGSHAVEAAGNLDRVLDSLAQLGRHPKTGLFYSWYRSATGEITNRNVSSVDNIHLALGLWSVMKAGPTEAVREKAKKLFASLDFAPFLRKDTGFVGGNLLWSAEKNDWALEDWNYEYLGSEARSIYSLGWALGLFHGVDEPTFAKGLDRLNFDVSRWKEKPRKQSELLHTWDGGIFQFFLPELLAGEHAYSPALAHRLGNVARFAYAEGKRLRHRLPTQKAGESLPVAASASNGAVDFSENKFGDVPAYVAFSGVERLTATANKGEVDPEHRRQKQQLLTPHAVFLLSLFERDRAVSTLATLEGYEGPRIASSTNKEALYLPGCGFMDGLWVAGSQKGKVVPVVLHLDQGMSALAAAAHARPGRLTFPADTLRRDPAVAERLRFVYDRLNKKIDDNARKVDSGEKKVPVISDAPMQE